MREFFEVCKRRDLCKSKLIKLGGEEGLVCEGIVDGRKLEHVS